MDAGLHDLHRESGSEFEDRVHVRAFRPTWFYMVEDLEEQGSGPNGFDVGIGGANLLKGVDADR